MQASTQDAPPDPSTRRWHQVRPEEALAELGSGPGGLGSDEAIARLGRHGRNELVVARAVAWYRVLLRQFVSPMIGILVICLTITLLLGEWVDAGAIAVILALNAGLGYWQERKAERDVRALATLSAPSSVALRDGAPATIPAAELVPGDVVLLDSGDRVPADLLLLETQALSVDESMLTGESEAVGKDTRATMVANAPIADRTNMAFSGTLVRAGRARGLVVATGIGTELGAISELIQGPPGKTPLEELTHGLEKRIGVIIAVVSALLFGSGVALGNDPVQMFLTIVALAVATVPESLPIVLTVAMSVGVSRMARRRALVRSLPAVETLGSTTIIGSDKTGTLTMNEMTVRSVWTHAGTVSLDDAVALTPVLRQHLRCGALTNEATESGTGELVGDAVDVAMAKAALGTGALTDGERRAEPLAHAPYEPDLRLSQSVYDLDGRRILCVKGAPDALAAAATHQATDQTAVTFDVGPVDAANQVMAAAGLRVLATAYRELAPQEQILEVLPPPRDLTFLGLQGMEDPPRPGVKEAIVACREAGIGVVMITGDQPATAVSIARQVGLPAGASPITGAEIADLDDDALLARLRETSVAARVSPQDKMRIVEVLQADGEVVAVTGDGVNDAPALKRASLGVAMGESGTDVAREAADVVLTDDNFVTVVDAVEQGRIIFSAIRKATHFLLATGAASLLAVSASVFADMPLIFLPIQMLFINVVTNGVQDIALAFEDAEGDELRQPPRSAGEGVLNRTLWIRTGIVGAWMGMVTLLTFMWGLEAGLAEAHARTLTLTLFVMMNFYLVQTSRFETRSLFSNPFGNRLLLITSLLALMLHWGAMTWGVSANLLGLVPLSPAEWLVCIVLGLSVLAIVEADKAIRRWRGRTRVLNSQ